MGRRRGEALLLDRTSKLLAVAMIAAGLLAVSLACAGTDPSTRAQRAPTASGHGYALLHAILEQEKQVSQLLIIKRDREALGSVIDEIAETCGSASKQLETLAARSPRLDLSDTGLPAEEVQTRLAIGATRRDLLLASTGNELELQLLLTQVEALTYAGHLADTLSRSEPDPERLAFVRALWKDLSNLLYDVQGLLRRPARSTG